MVRVRHSRQFHARAAGLVVLAALATGCKAGSWGTKPSWWSFGGTPPASALTAAPSFDKDKDVPKPSEAAKPYPTTNTPEGYALSDATKTDPARPAESPAVAVAPTSVTYGASPPPAAAQTTPAAAPAAVAQTSVGPQVGPYASLQPQSPTPPPATAIDPAGAATAGMAAAPAFGEAAPPMAQVPTARPPAGRYADASGQAWPPAAAPAAPAATGVPAGDDRYGVSTGSRFGGGPADFAPAPAGPPPTAPLESPAVPPPAAPPITPAAPATVPATLAPAMTAPAAVPPPAAPGGAVLPGAVTPPTRRADPGYRPGGTTNYRPSKTILAGEEAPAPGVLPASFEAPAAAE